jgi:hypothetical protein
MTARNEPTKTSDLNGSAEKVDVPIEVSASVVVADSVGADSVAARPIPAGEARSDLGPVVSWLAPALAAGPASADSGSRVGREAGAGAARSDAGPASSASVLGADDAEPVDVGSVGASGCRASAILARGGPSAVPFDLCCVMAIIRASGPEPGPLVCGALDLLELGEPAESPLVAVAESAT